MVPFIPFHKKQKKHRVLIMGVKGLAKKLKLGKAGRKIKRIPAFVMVRTKRKVTFNRRKRDWRTDKLRIEDSD